MDDETLKILRECCPTLRVPHVWGGPFAGRLFEPQQRPLLDQWLRITGGVGLAVDSGAAARLITACEAAREAGLQSLAVSFCWAPLPEYDPQKPTKQHGAGVWREDELLLPWNNPKWAMWQDYWTKRLAGWAEACLAAASSYGLEFIRPSLVIDQETFKTSAVRGDLDAALAAIVDRIEDLGRDKLVGSSSPIYWYGYGDVRLDGTPCPYFPARRSWEGRPASPVCYHGGAGDNIRRLEWARLPQVEAPELAPFWTPAGEWLKDKFYYEGERRSLREPSSRTALGAYLGWLVDRERLAALITWPGPGHPKCPDDIYAYQFSDLSRGVDVSLGPD